MGMVINQYEVYLVDRSPCLVISPNEMNHSISTVIVAPMTTKSHSFPTRIEIEFNKKNGWIVLDQIRTIDKLRFVKKLGKIEKKEIMKVKKILQEMLID